MSEERTTCGDRYAHLYSNNLYTRWKLTQFLSTTAQKAVDYIGGSKKAHMNIGEYSQTLFAIPPQIILFYGSGLQPTQSAFLILFHDLSIDRYVVQEALP